MGPPDRRVRGPLRAAVRGLIAPPVLGVRGDDAERIARLERTGVVRPPDAVSDWVPLLRPSPVADRQGAVRAALRAEREEGR